MYKTRASNLSFPFFDQGEGKKCAKWQVFCKNKIAIPKTTQKDVAGLSGQSYSCILQTFAEDLQIMQATLCNVAHRKSWSSRKNALGSNTNSINVTIRKVVIIFA